ncbi:FHA domain-containing protein, partial [bacterium]|nr:FHA domain-containing protein [bacterium]
MTSFLVIPLSGGQRLISSRKTSLRIGRLPDCEIAVEDPRVSRRHAEVYRTETGCYLHDAGSRNGTFLNGARVSMPAELAPGDTIMVGTTRIIYEPSAVMCLLEEAASEPVSFADVAALPHDDQATAPLMFLEAVADIARQMVQDRPMEGLLDSILKLCIEKTGAERAAILLMNERNDLHPCAYRSTSRDQDPFALSRSIVRKATEGKKAILIKDVAGDEELKASESVLGLKIRSAVCTPLWNGEKMLGVLYVDSTSPEHQLGEVDLLFFSSLSGMVAERIENAILADMAREKHRLDDEVETAREIQSRLFPRTLPTIEGYQVAAINRPCTEVGGDYFDIIPCGEHFGIAIADVVGKGIGAAMLMSNLQALLHSRAAEFPDPGRLLGAMNAELLSRVGEDRFITFFYLLIDPRGNRIIYSNGGHNAPLLFRVDGKIEFLPATGLPLGILESSDYDTLRLEMEPGDLLLLYTDGITECMDATGGMFGEERLKAVLEKAAGASAEAVKTAVCKAVDDFRGD